ncbi:MAG TPA: glycosyltransferase [Hyphomicrobiaceae bacterium]|nr:glycosyltransferase [Hyphomicrobiaceae bacterium]
MNIFFVHQNYPGQFRESLPRLAADGHKITFLTQRRIQTAPRDHQVLIYKPERDVAKDAYRFSRWFETNCVNGNSVLRAARVLSQRGYKPDLIVGHIGWGEMMFLADVWPDVPVAGYFEYYFIPKGGSVGFDTEFPEAPDTASLLHARNAMNYLSLVRTTRGFTASQWQKDTYPALFHDKIDVLHEGIRADRLIPDHTSALEVTIGDFTYRRGEEIVTYIARNLEPTRGFHTFMRALPDLLKARPNARVVIVGGDDVSYGRSLGGGDTFRQKLTREVFDRVDWPRVQFAGQIPYGKLCDLLRLASAHVYLTVPFVVSWSMLEAMALEKVVIASDVAPVRQFITPGRDGLLVDFFDPAGLARTIARVLADPAAHAPIGAAARQTIVERFDFNSICYPRFRAFLEGTAADGPPRP